MTQNLLKKLALLKMDAKKFSFEDLKKIFISKEDFMTAINRIKLQKKL